MGIGGGNERLWIWDALCAVDNVAGVASKAGTGIGVPGSAKIRYSYTFSLNIRNVSG